MNDDGFEKEHESRRKFFEALGFTETSEHHYVLQQEYAYPECLATTVVAEYSVDDGAILGGMIYTEVWLRALKTDAGKLTLCDTDLYITLSECEHSMFSKDKMRKYIKELMRSTEAKLKNIFKLVRIS